jgi:hypothetical protein
VDGALANEAMIRELQLKEGKDIRCATNLFSNIHPYGR